MTLKKKTKFPANRELKSDAFKNGKAAVTHYTTNPCSQVTVMGSLPDVVKSDISAAIDEVLSFHGL